MDNREVEKRGGEFIQKGLLGRVDLLRKGYTRQPVRQMRLPLPKKTRAA